MRLSTALSRLTLPPILTIALTLLGLLMFVWPIPHTISMRYLLVLVVFGLFLYLIHENRRPSLGLREMTPSLALLLAFIGWMSLVALLNSSRVAASFDEIRGQWLAALLAGGIGMLAARELQQQSWRGLAFAGVVLVPLMMHVLVVDLVGVLSLFDAAKTSHRIAGLTERPDTSNYLTNIVIALMLAELFVRMRNRRNFLPIGNSVLSLLIVVTLGSLYFESMRNGAALIALLLLVWFVILIIDSRRSGKGRRFQLGASVVAFVVIAGLVVGAAGFKPGTSWQRFVATVPVALDTERHREWLDPFTRVPALADGSAVDFSAYVRFAWLKEGAILIAERPLGVGFGRNVFGEQISAKYNVDFRNHSHSSVVDLAIGTGIPGVLMWYGFLGGLLMIGWRRFWAAGSGYALALVFVVVDFGARSFIDANVRDHILQQFMFLAGMLSVLALSDTPEPKRDG